MTSYPSPDEWYQEIRKINVFFIILLIGTIILLALGYISWKVFAGLFILGLILCWRNNTRGYRIPECDIVWDEEEQPQLEPSLMSNKKPLPLTPIFVYTGLLALFIIILIIFSQLYDQTPHITTIHWVGLGAALISYSY